MKISKSKRQLARLLIEAGVKQFPEGANWAAQDKDDKTVYMHEIRPERHLVGDDHFSRRSVVLCGSFPLPTLIPNWHQTVLSCAEFDQIVAEGAEHGKPDADGWIEWNGGLCPVDGNDLVDVKFKTGQKERKFRAGWAGWEHIGSTSDIIAYRLHNPEQAEPQYCESVTPENFAEKIDVERVKRYLASHGSEQVTAPTLDQLLQDYRNASDFAAAKQAEADEAAKMRDERWKSAQARACELGVHISVGLVVDTEMRESGLVITDWRDLRVGDIVIITSVFMGGGNLGYEKIIGNEAVVMVVGDPDYQGLAVDFLGSALYIDGYHFIRRP